MSEVTLYQFNHDYFGVLGVYRQHTSTVPYANSTALEAFFDGGGVSKSIPFTLYPISNTLYPIPYTLYPIPYTLHPIPCTLYHIPHTLYPIPYTLHPTPCTLYPIPYALYPTPYTLARVPRCDACRCSSLAPALTLEGLVTSCLFCRLPTHGVRSHSASTQFDSCITQLQLNA